MDGDRVVLRCKRVESRKRTIRLLVAEGQRPLTVDHGELDEVDSRCLDDNDGPIPVDVRYRSDGGRADHAETFAEGFAGAGAASSFLKSGSITSTATLGGNLRRRFPARSMTK